MDQDWDRCTWCSTMGVVFAAAVARPLTSVEPIRNEIGEVVGLRADFDGQTLTLTTCQGDIRT